MATEQKEKSGVAGYISWLYLQYCLVTGLYMLEPIERRVFNSILIFFLLMGAYSAYVFLPGHIAYALDVLGINRQN